jgi:hypothetical protein
LSITLEVAGSSHFRLMDAGWNEPGGVSFRSATELEFQNFGAGWVRAVA